MLTEVESQALFLSLKVSLTGVACALPLALLTAMALARFRFPGRGFVEAIFSLPLVLPPVVIGYLLLMTFGPREIVGAWLARHLGLVLAFNWKGAALAAGMITFPFQMRAIRFSLEGIDRGLIEAAQTLGARAIDRFLNIILPLALPGIVAGAITAFSVALGEFGAIITFVSNIPGETQTLPLAIFSVLQQPGGEIEAERLSALSILLALGGILLAQLADRRARALLLT